jgi:ubiquinone/menaquinone biosynthesis C-methylase UbiE
MLAERFPAATLIALDFSPEMLAKARHKLKNKTIAFVCAEGEQFLEEAQGKSFDLVVSNGSLQWFTDIDRTCNNIARILRPGGRFFGSIFGPDSLTELASGLRAILGLKEMLAAETFPGQDSLWTVLHNNFQDGKVEQELITQTYPSTHDLLLHIKKTGTSGWQQNMQQPLTQSRINRLDEWFSRIYGSCRVTYQVLFLQGNN